MRVERHPKLNIWVREDGCIYLPQSGKHPAHWTFGFDNGHGYLQVGIGGKLFRCHRLVAEAYFGDIPKDCEVDHINRDKRDNRVENLRIVSKSENRRNTPYHDRVESRGGVHWYEDKRQYSREQSTRYIQYKSKTHRRIYFSDGSYRWIPLEEADAYLLIPLKERHYGK